MPAGGAGAPSSGGGGFFGKSGKLKVCMRVPIHVSINLWLNSFFIDDHIVAGKDDTTL